MVLQRVPIGSPLAPCVSAAMGPQTDGAALHGASRLHRAGETAGTEAAKRLGLAAIRMFGEAVVALSQFGHCADRETSAGVIGGGHSTRGERVRS